MKNPGCLSRLQYRMGVYGVFVLCLVLCCVGCAVLSGCCGQGHGFEAKKQICLVGVDKTEAMEAAEDVLASMYFSIDKYELEQGYIRTNPMPGGQFFELWRSDNTTLCDAAEASIHTIRKTVELHLGREQAGLCINCDVQVERLSVPERQGEGIAQAQTMFAEGFSALGKLKLSEEQKKEMAWLDYGTDAGFETEILNRIEKRLAH